MKILVCIKAVRASETDGTSDRVCINRFDEFALEEALQMRKSAGHGTVDAISVGPKQTCSVLTRAVGLGADQGIQILADDEEFPDPFCTASMIAAYAQDKKYDLILCGVMSEDLMQGQTGPMIAEILSLPCATAVISAQLSQDAKQMDVEREMEAGRREKWKIQLPALLTIQSGINTPKYPALSRMLFAVRQQQEIINSETLGIPRIRQRVISTDFPQKQRSGLVLEGTCAQKAETLINIFREKGFLKQE